MFLVEDILKIKGNEVYTAAPEMPIQEALQIMANNNLGALVVVEGEKVVGIFSERDLARRIIGKDACSLATKVKQIMTSPVSTVSPTTSIEECMELMTDKRIRHLPVLKDDRLVGVISIGDVVKGILTNREALIDQLKDYISGSGYGR